MDNEVPESNQSSALGEDVPGAPANRENHTDWLPAPPLVYRAAKRAIDIAFSLFALVLIAPCLAVIATAIKLTSKGPVMFRQERLGYHGKRFKSLKFRTMNMINEPAIHARYVQQLIAGKLGPVGEQTTYKLSNDPRITPVGRFLRRTSLDELPQFWNVLRGDMTLVGPRPPIPYEWERYEPWHKQRLSSKPGITGLWQVKGRSRTTFDAMVELDIQYARNPSLLLDLKILLSTPIAAIRSDKAF